jgi:hypothetical protein
MLKPAPPTPNIERQRQFRERNPGYFRKYYARKKSSWLAAKAKRAAQWQAAAAEVPAQREPLMLPAPAVVPILPGLNTIPAMPAAAPPPLPFTLPMMVTIPTAKAA